MPETIDETEPVPAAEPTLTERIVYLENCVRALLLSHTGSATL